MEDHKANHRHRGHHQSSTWLNERERFGQKISPYNTAKVDSKLGNSFVTLCRLPDDMINRTVPTILGDE